MKLGSKGFSLVELIIVIAIIAVLAGTITPMYIKYT
jgi:prepilin-type N-terminal cleavage/methylation domain-containing protein